MSLSEYRLDLKGVKGYDDPMNTDAESLTNRRLMDSDTVEFIGFATPAQADASDEAVKRGQYGGSIRINRDGDVVVPGSWGYDQPGTRDTYVEDKA